MDEQPPGPGGEVTCVQGESFCISGTTGQIRDGGDQGLFIRDTRVLNRLLLRIDGNEPSPLGFGLESSATATFAACRYPHVKPDPEVLIERHRTVSDSMVEQIRLTNYGQRERTVAVELLVGSDFAYIFDVKHGRTLASAAAQEHDGELRLLDAQLERRVEVRASPPADGVNPPEGRLVWHVTLAARASWRATVSFGFIEVSGATWPSPVASLPGETAGNDVAALRAPLLTSSDPGVAALLDRSVRDLASLLVSDPAQPGERFLAAGSPWYLTLFGRDSLWAARMALPLGVDLARDTLHILARRQGQRHDPDTDESPGKILHEVRHGELLERGDLPPVYYGSIDATMLWIILLSEAWRWGLGAAEVERLLPALDAALRWLRDDADADGDGFIEYHRISAGGLSNQGWKDSHDSISFADGRLADAPIALAEVQGYAYDAAIRAAELLDHFGRPGGDGWRRWAAALRDRFRQQFWVEDPTGPYPAIALDRDKRPVDAVASNMGHLPATGLLDRDEIAHVAQRLTRPDMASGWGLRTLSALSPRFNPLSYHNGSVWPHDTAIAVANLAWAGMGQQAGKLAGELWSAAPFFGNRLPELFAGQDRDRHSFPLPYPAACHPQAWAAGSALLILQGLLGLQPHVPDGHLRLRPVEPSPLALAGVVELPLGSGHLRFQVKEGQVTEVEAPPGIQVVQE